MTISSDAIKILINAQDDASDKFGRVGDAAEGLHGKLKSFASEGLKGFLDPVASLATKLTAGAVALKVFQGVVEGAGGKFENSLTKKVDEAVSGVFKLTDGIGSGFKAASQALPQNSWLNTVAKYGETFFSNGPRGLFGMWQAGLREIGNAASGAQLPEPIDMPFLKADKRTNKEKMSWARAQQNSLQAEATQIGGKEFKTVLEEQRLKQIGTELQRINRYVEILNRTPYGVAAAIFGANPAIKQQNKSALASGFSALDGVKAMFGGNVNAAKGDAHKAFPWIQFIKDDADRHDAMLKEEAAKNEAKFQEAKGIIDQNMPAHERFDKEAKRIAEFQDMGGLNEEQAKRALDGARRRILNPQTGDNGAMVSRFGGGIVRQGSPAEQETQKVQKDQLKELREMRKAQDKFLEKLPVRANQIVLVPGMLKP